MKNLQIQAGPAALLRLRQGGLEPNDVQVMLGAAGGPKWLILSHIDRMLFSSWLPLRTMPLHLIGSSSGAWRFAALTQADPLAAIDRLENGYVNQAYSNSPTPAEVTRGAINILDQFLNPEASTRILNHRHFRLSVVTVRPNWLLASTGNKMVSLLMLLAVLLNICRRQYLQLLFQRVFFHDPRQPPPLSKKNGFAFQKIPLTLTNLKWAVLASGSIPVVTEGVRKIPGAPENLYLDGGIMDYHLDLPLQLNPQAITLYPHYAPRLIPGWLDKRLKWRKPDSRNLNNTILVTPSPAFIRQLPFRRIPDRNDFLRFKGKDKERIAYWKEAIQTSELLAEELYELLNSGRIAQVAQPFPLGFSTPN
jgi:hypothetical protein